MIRRALIIYCDTTESGKLNGPIEDEIKYRAFLKSQLGGNWLDDEILSLNNPTKNQVNRAITYFLSGSDYTFIVFSGHGYINTDLNNRQFLEINDGDISVTSLRTSSERQTLIIDACRGYYSPSAEIQKGLSGISESTLFSAQKSTRNIFDNAVLNSEKGWTILYAANENETALDTDEGGAFLISMLETAKLWKRTEKRQNILEINIALTNAKKYLYENFDTIQKPVMNREKRNNYFPFAVKFIQING